MACRAPLAALALAFACRPALADPVSILFVGNSFTHGRYGPALTYKAGPGDAPGHGQVHDLLCPSLPCPGAKGVAPVVPTAASTPGGTLAAQLAYLQDTPSARYTEAGPFGGVAGIFLQMTGEAGLDYDVSLLAVSAATLKGYADDTGSEAGALPLIESARWKKVVLQDQSFQPLPATITVDGAPVPTRGNPASFRSGVSTLVAGIDAADQAAGVPNAAIILAQTPPLAAYGYGSANPAAPIFGSGTPAAHNGNKVYAPYLGDADPVAAMASDLHDAYITEAAAFNAANPAGSQLGVSLDGDAWVTAINLGIAQRNPFLVNEPPGQVDLWDSDPLLACCTVPIGYHPSVYGDYLDALMLFGSITGADPRTLTAELDASDPGFSKSAAAALGIAAPVAKELASAAELTLRAGGPVRASLQPGQVRPGQAQ